MCFHILINDLACHSFALGRFFINLAGLPPPNFIWRYIFCYYRPCSNNRIITYFNAIADYTISANKTSMSDFYYS